MILPCLRCYSEMVPVLRGYKCFDCGFFLPYEALDSIFAPVGDKSEAYKMLEKIMTGKES